MSLRFINLPFYIKLNCLCIHPTCLNNLNFLIVIEVLKVRTILPMSERMIIRRSQILKAIGGFNTSNFSWYKRFCICWVLWTWALSCNNTIPDNSQHSWLLQMTFFKISSICYFYMLFFFWNLLFTVIYYHHLMSSYSKKYYQSSYFPFGRIFNRSAHFVSL